VSLLPSRKCKNLAGREKRELGLAYPCLKWAHTVSGRRGRGKEKREGLKFECLKRRTKLREERRKERSEEGKPSCFMPLCLTVS
jgi:hypothetical protein